MRMSKEAFLGLAVTSLASMCACTEANSDAAPSIQSDLEYGVEIPVGDTLLNYQTTGPFQLGSVHTTHKTFTDRSTNQEINVSGPSIFTSTKPVDPDFLGNHDDSQNFTVEVPLGDSARTYNTHTVSYGQESNNVSFINQQTGQYVEVNETAIITSKEHEPASQNPTHYEVKAPFGKTTRTYQTDGAVVHDFKREGVTFTDARSHSRVTILGNTFSQKL